jgi:hypothetical protein
VTYSHFFCDIFTPWRRPTERWVKCWEMWQEMEQVIHLKRGATRLL